MVEALVRALVEDDEWRWVANLLLKVLLSIGCSTDTRYILWIWTDAEIVVIWMQSERLLGGCRGYARGELDVVCAEESKLLSDRLLRLCRGKQRQSVGCCRWYCRDSRANGDTWLQMLRKTTTAMHVVRSVHGAIPNRWRGCRSRSRSEDEMVVYGWWIGCKWRGCWRSFGCLWEIRWWCLND